LVRRKVISSKVSSHNGVQQNTVETLPLPRSWMQFFKVFIFLFFFLAPLLIIPGYIEGSLLCTLYVLPKTVFIVSCSILLFSIWLLLLSRHSKVMMKFRDFLCCNVGFRLVSLLLVWMGCSLLFAKVLEVAGLAFVTFLFFGVFWLVLCPLFLSFPLRWAAVWGLVASYAVFVLLGWGQGLFETKGVLPLIVPISKGFPTATFANRNFAAQFLVFGLPFVLFAAGRVWRETRISGKKIWYWLLAGLLAVVVGALVQLFANSSKNAILALLFEILYLPLAWYWLQSRGRENGSGRRRFYKYVAGALAGVLLVLSLAMAAPGPRRKLMQSWHRFQKNGVTGVLHARYLFWRNTMVMIKDHPLVGVGVGNFEVVYPLYCRSYAWDTVTGYKKRARRAHNDYLQVAAECGIPALFLFLLLLGRQFYLLRIPEPGDDEDGGVVWGDWRLPLGAALLAYVVVMCFSFPLQVAYGRMFFFFLIALGEARAWRASLK
jgi:O-antigen ligase